MRETFAAIIVILLVYSVSCSDWFTIVNLSPYHFPLSNGPDENLDFVSNLRPLSVQNVGLRFNATKRIQIVYGDRLMLHLAKDVGRVRMEDIMHDSTIAYNYDPYINMLTIRATDSNVDKFTFIVSSDPQPYRLANDGDPNWQRDLWSKSTVPVFRRIAKEETDAHLMIVNGDLTEFGRTTQWKTFQNAISEIPITMAFGLGNHDYQNNVGDCADLDPSKSESGTRDSNSTSENASSNWLSKWASTNVGKLADSIGSYFSPSYLKRLKNLCARRMVDRMRDHTRNLSKLLWDFSSDERSLAYGWNYGSVLRFVQLHNRPNYAVELKGFLQRTTYIKSSRDWLISDMNRYKDRSYILNIHDAMSHSDLEELRPYLGRIKAIFAGHTHEAGVKCYNGVAIFDSGALFKNEFLRVNFSQNGRCFDVLHFVQDKYVSPMATNYCFQSILDNPCK